MKAVFLVLAFVALNGYAKADGLTTQQRQDQELLQLKRLENGINKFAVNLYKSTLKRHSKNFVTCPFGAYMALAMVAYGAEGKTQEELLQALHLSGENLNGVGPTLAQLFKNIQIPTGNSSFAVANGFFAKSGASVQPRYQDIVKIAFKSALTAVNFNDRIRTAESINSWSYRNTLHSDNFIDAHQVQPASSLLLVSAAMFDAIWYPNFASVATEPTPFYVNKSTVKNVTTMYRGFQMDHGILPKLNASFVVIPCKDGPYEKGAFDMYVILPENPDGLPQVEENIDSLTLEDLQKTSNDHIPIYMPQFKIYNTLTLADDITKLGVRRVFSPMTDFYGITQSTDNLQIDNLIQKAGLSAEEKGTKGTVPKDIQDLLEPMIMPSKIFKFNRPFFIVVATKSVILLTAKIADPSIQN